VKDYVVEYLFHSGDENEEKLREVYAEYNKKELTREELVEGLLRKGYTRGEIEEILKKYTTIEVPEEERKKWDEASKLFRRPEYKPLKHHKSKRIARKTNGDIIVEDIPNCYEIMQIEEWKLKEYEDLNYLRQSARYIYGTRKVPFRAIRKIFRDAENQGKRTLKRNELIRRIVEECNTTEEEAKIATHGAELTFKIRTVTPALRKIWRLAIDSQNFLVFCGGFAYFSWVFWGGLQLRASPGGFFPVSGVSGGLLSAGAGPPPSPRFFSVFPLSRGEAWWVFWGWRGLCLGPPSGRGRVPG